MKKCVFHIDGKSQNIFSGKVVLLSYGKTCRHFNFGYNRKKITDTLHECSPTFEAIASVSRYLERNS